MEHRPKMKFPGYRYRWMSPVSPVYGILLTNLAIKSRANCKSALFLKVPQLLYQGAIKTPNRLNRPRAASSG
jgi:hypothetical protein